MFAPRLIKRQTKYKALFSSDCRAFGQRLRELRPHPRNVMICCNWLANMRLRRHRPLYHGVHPYSFVLLAVQA